MLGVVLAVVFLHWAVQRQLPARLLKQQLTRALGFPVLFADYHLSWGGELRMHHLQLLDAESRPFLSVDEAELDLDRGQALRGRLQVEQIVLEQPRLELSARRWEQIRQRPSHGKGHRTFPLLVRDLELVWLRPDGVVAWQTGGWSGELPPPSDLGWSLVLHDEHEAALEARPGFLRLENFPLVLLAGITATQVPFLQPEDRVSAQALREASGWNLTAKVQAEVYRGSLQGSIGPAGWKLEGAAERVRSLGAVTGWRLESDDGLWSGEVQFPAGGQLTLSGRSGGKSFELSGLVRDLSLGTLDALHGKGTGLLSGRWRLQGPVSAPEFSFAGRLRRGSPLKAAPLAIDWKDGRGELRVGPLSIGDWLWVQKHLPRLRGVMELSVDWPAGQGMVRLTRLRSGPQLLPSLEAQARWTGLGLADCRLHWDLSPRPLELRGSIGLFSSLEGQFQGQSLRELTLGALPVDGKLYGNLTCSASGLHLEGTVPLLKYGGLVLGDARLELQAGSRLRGEVLWKRSLPARVGHPIFRPLLSEPWPAGQSLQGLRVSGSPGHPVCQGAWGH